MTASAFGTPAKTTSLEVIDYRTSLKAELVSEFWRLKRSSGGYLAFVGLFERELRGSLEETYQRLLGQAPAVLIRVGDSQISRVTAAKSRYSAQIDVEVTYFSGHLRSHEARVGGDASSLDGRSDQGIDRMLADGRGLLSREMRGVADLGSDINEVFTLGSEDGQVWTHTATFFADVRPANVPPEGSRRTVESVQVDSTIPEAVPRDATKTTTLTTGADDE